MKLQLATSKHGSHSAQQISLNVDWDVHTHAILLHMIRYNQYDTIPIQYHQPIEKYLTRQCASVGMGCYQAWQVPFPAIWDVLKPQIFLERSAPTYGGAPLR